MFWHGLPNVSAAAIARSPDCAQPGETWSAKVARSPDHWYLHIFGVEPAGWDLCTGVRRAIAEAVLASGAWSFERGASTGCGGQVVAGGWFGLRRHPGCLAVFRQSAGHVTQVGAALARGGPTSRRPQFFRVCAGGPRLVEAGLRRPCLQDGPRPTDQCSGSRLRVGDRPVGGRGPRSPLGTHGPGSESRRGRAEHRAGRPRRRVPIGSRSCRGWRPAGVGISRAPACR
jgi:hypothetical protein